MKKHYSILLFLTLGFAGLLQGQTTFAPPHFTAQTKQVVVPADAIADPFIRDGLIQIKLENKVAYINTQGDYVFGFNFPMNTTARCRGIFSGGAAVISREYGKFTIICPDRKYLDLDKSYKQVSDFCDGIAMAQKELPNNKKSIVYLNTQGAEVLKSISYSYTYSSSLQLQVAPLREGLRAFFDPNSNKWGYADASGNITIQPKYTRALAFSDGLAAVEVEEKQYGPKFWGFIDKTGTMVIPATYKAYPGSFHEGLCAVRPEEEYSGKMVFIDKKGTVVSPEYYACNHFFDGFAFVKTGTSKMVVINKQFEVVREIPSFDIPKDDVNKIFGFEFTDGLAAVGRASFDYDIPVGNIIRSNGEVVLNAGDKSRSFFTNFYNGELAMFTYQIDEKWIKGFMNKAGEIILHFVEDDQNMPSPGMPTPGICKTGGGTTPPPAPPKLYKLALPVNPPAAGSTSGAGEYEARTEVNVSTTPADPVKYQWIGWIDETGKTVSGSRNFDYTMPGKNTVLTATYKEKQKFTLTVVSSDESIGTVTGSGVYYAGETIEIKATVVGKGYKFKGWYLDKNTTPISRSSIYKYTMPAQNTTLTGVFEEGEGDDEEKRMLILSSNLKSARYSGEGKYLPGTNIPVKVSILGKNKFVGWFEGATCISTTEEFQYSMPDRTVLLKAVYQKGGGGSSGGIVIDNKDKKPEGPDPGENVNCDNCKDCKLCPDCPQCREKSPGDPCKECLDCKDCPDCPKCKKEGEKGPEHPQQRKPQPKPGDTGKEVLPGNNDSIRVTPEHKDSILFTPRDLSLQKDSIFPQDSVYVHKIDTIRGTQWHVGSHTIRYKGKLAGDTAAIPSTVIIGLSPLDRAIKSPYADSIAGVIYFDVQGYKSEGKLGQMSLTRKAASFPWSILKITPTELYIGGGALYFGFDFISQGTAALQQVYRVPYSILPDQSISLGKWNQFSGIEAEPVKVKNIPIDWYIKKRDILSDARTTEEDYEEMKEKFLNEMEQNIFPGTLKKLGELRVKN